jgi:hypothetical protein
MNRDAALQVHQIEQLQDFFVASSQAARSPAVTEMGGDDTVKVKERRQNRVNDRVLIVGLVLCVSVEDYSNFFGRLRDKEWIHGFG